MDVTTLIAEISWTAVAMVMFFALVASFSNPHGGALIGVPIIAVVAWLLYTTGNSAIRNCGKRNTWRVICFNSGHSYPGFPDGDIGGTLALEPAGLVFKANGAGRSLAIPWEHLKESESGVSMGRSLIEWFGWLLASMLVLPVMVVTLGVIAPWYGFVTVCWSDEYYDKECRVRFRIYLPTAPNVIQARVAANVLGQQLWNERATRRHDLKDAVVIHHR